MIYDSKVGFLALKALSLIDELENDEINFNKRLKSKVIKIQNDVLTQETISSNSLKFLSNISGIIAGCL